MKLSGHRSVENLGRIGGGGHHQNKLYEKNFNKEFKIKTIDTFNRVMWVTQANIYSYGQIY